MKLTIDRVSLLRPLGHVQSVVERRNTIPILANVVLHAENGQLSLTATDMDMDIATEVGCAVATSGTTTMSAHMLYDIARKLPDGAEVELTVADGHVNINAGRSSFRLPTLPVEDFPAISSNDLPVNFTLTAADLRDLVDTTRFAISNEETRYYLNGIYLHKAEDGNLCAVATDGHRLALTRQALPSGASQMPSVILPRKAVGELRKLLDDYDGDVSVGLSETRAEFSFGVIRLTSKLIDGTFPDYTRVIPSGNDRVMKIDAASFLLSSKARDFAAFDKGQDLICGDKFKSGDEDRVEDLHFVSKIYFLTVHALRLGPVQIMRKVNLMMQQFSNIQRMLSQNPSDSRLQMSHEMILAKKCMYDCALFEPDTVNAILRFVSLTMGVLVHLAGGT